MRCARCGHEGHPEGARFCVRCGEALGPTSAEGADASHPATLGDGRYVLVRLIGEGGRKRVYLARDTRLDRDVALALLKTEGLDAAGLARLRREAQTMARLGDHPHVVTIHDVGEDGGRLYIVTQ